MLFIPMELALPGMVIAKDIESEISFSKIPLVIKGQILTESLVRSLLNKQIAGIYVESEVVSDISAVEIISPQVKQRALIDIKKVYDEVDTTNEIRRENTTKISKVAKSLVLEILSNDDVLIDILDIKGYDDYTYRHSLFVAIYSISIGVMLGYSEDLLVDLAIGSLLHDIGKTEISIDIINKPGKLTEAEYNIIKMHPSLAVKQLRSNKKMTGAILNGIETHHERWDGTGYPFGFKGDEIPVYGRILAVADVYDALTSKRPYRKAWYPNEAIEYLLGCSGIHYDPKMIEAFLKVVVPYPTGTVVELSNGCDAIVISNKNSNRLRPVVRMFNVSDDASFIDIDLMNDRSYYNLTILGLGYKNNKIDYTTLTGQRKTPPEKE